VYSLLKPEIPIRQGDIFRFIPKIELLLGSGNLPLLYENTEKGNREIDWFQAAEAELDVITTLKVRSVTGIVISQDCDASRAVHVAFCEIKPFKAVNSDYQEVWGTPKFVEELIKHVRKSQKWFYLAEDNNIGFTNKMGVDFESVFQVNRAMLEAHIERLRVGRLDDDVACPHFRERVAEFFRRYPYNEWYPFNSKEVDAYEKLKKTSVDRYSWNS
jgi:hypothetical protein